MSNINNNNNNTMIMTSTDDGAHTALHSDIICLIADWIGSRASSNADGRRDLLRFAHACRDTYVAAFPYLWSTLKLVFTKDPNASDDNDQFGVIQLHGSGVAPKTNIDRHVDVKRQEVKHSGLVSGLVGKQLADKIAQVSEAGSLLVGGPFAVLDGQLYLASLAPEADHDGAAVKAVKAGVQSLWTGGRSDAHDIDVRITSNGLLLIQYPLWVVSKLVVDDMDSANPVPSLPMVAGFDVMQMFPGLADASHGATDKLHVRPLCSWLPSLYSIPPRQLKALVVMSNSAKWAAEVYRDLGRRFTSIRTYDLAVQGLPSRDESGDESPFMPARHPSLRSMTLFHDGQWESPSHHILRGFEQTPAGFALAQFHLHGSDTFSPIATEMDPDFPDMPTSNPMRLSLDPILRLQTLTHLTLDLPVQQFAAATIQPLLLPALTHLTAAFDAFWSIFSPPQTSSPAFPLLADLTLLIDTHIDLSSMLASGLETVDLSDLLYKASDVPFAHMPNLTHLRAPRAYRGRPLAGWQVSVEWMTAMITHCPKLMVVDAPTLRIEQTDADQEEQAALVAPSLEELHVHADAWTLLYNVLDVSQVAKVGLTGVKNLIDLSMLKSAPANLTHVALHTPRFEPEFWRPLAQIPNLAHLEIVDESPRLSAGKQPRNTIPSDLDLKPLTFTHLRSLAITLPDAQFDPTGFVFPNFDTLYVDCIHACLVCKLPNLIGGLRHLTIIGPWCAGTLPFVLAHINANCEIQFKRAVDLPALSDSDPLECPVDLKGMCLQFKDANRHVWRAMATDASAFRESGVAFDKEGILVELCTSNVSDADAESIARAMANLLSETGRPDDGDVSVNVVAGSLLTGAGKVSGGIGQDENKARVGVSKVKAALGRCANLTDSWRVEE